MRRVAWVMALGLVVGCTSDDPPGKISPPRDEGVSAEEPVLEEPAAGAPAAAPVDVGGEPLRAGLGSLEALGRAVVDGLDAQDAAALRAVAVDEAEYTRLYPALISHPNMARLGAGLAWTNQAAESLGDMDRAIREHGGKGYVFVALESTRSEARPGLVVHREPRLVVRDAQGTELELPILGTVLEHPRSGTFAVLTYTH
ncbi:MAG: hypothetical protein H6712_23895 [Myxococcales bacterium]|nr:hypothetical protein [Myxococcales bacterium]MCB9716922.1 hypothetical protein [Myxococcales bacterium]